jgi:hypothetical protein
MWFGVSYLRMGGLALSSHYSFDTMKSTHHTTRMSSIPLLPSPPKPKLFQGIRVLVQHDMLYSEIQQRIYACIGELPKSSQLTCCHVMKNERSWTVVFNRHCATYFFWNHKISDTLNLARRPWKVIYSQENRPINL